MQVKTESLIGDLLHSGMLARGGRVGADDVRRGFTLVELLVVIGIIAVLMSLLMPVSIAARDQMNRLKCANNLRQIGLAMVTYANGEHDNSFPRTVYDPDKKSLQLGTAGYGVEDSFGKKGYVDQNNVPASLFLLMKTQGMPGILFICPSTEGQAGFLKGDVMQSSNWENIPLNLSYSLATPFPTPVAAANGFSWKNRFSSEFALAADINPGTRGGSSPPNNVIGPAHNAPANKMAAANSNNHGNRGQNVLYGDGHVEFQQTPYCGATRTGQGFRDNIYTAGAGDGGATGDNAMPVDAADSVLFPTDDPGGK